MHARLGMRVLPQHTKVGEVFHDALCVASIDSYSLGLPTTSFSSSSLRRIFAKPAPTSQRRRLDNTLATGTIAWDAMCPLGLGASMIIQGPSDGLLDTLGKASNQVNRVLDAGSNYPEIFESIAEGSERAVQDKEHVLCLLDMSRFPLYFSEAREATDAARGKPLDMQAEIAEKRTFYSQIFERALCHLDGGTLTLVCRLGNEIALADLREMQSLCDGHLLLNNDGSINYRTSLSRFGLGSDTKGLRRHKMLQRVGSHIRTELCQFASETPQDDVGSNLAHIQNQILAAMKQTLDPVPVEEQIILLVAASTHKFADNNLLEGGCSSPLVEYFRANHRTLMDRCALDEVDGGIARDLDVALRIFNALNRPQ